jgi:hypothetical protein
MLESLCKDFLIKYARTYVYLVCRYLSGKFQTAAGQIFFLRGQAAQLSAMWRPLLSLWLTDLFLIQPFYRTPSSDGFRTTLRFLQYLSSQVLMRIDINTIS